MAGVAHGSREKARIEQMQNRVLDAADVLVDGQPVFRRLHVDRGFGFRRGEAHEVPGRIDEGVHRVGFASRVAVARRAFDVFPCRMAFKRVARLVERRVLGQRYRQVLFRNADDTAFLAMDDGDRAAPIALARDAPVAQPEIDLARSLRPVRKLLLLEKVGHFLERGLGRQSVEKAGIDHRAVVGIGFVLEIERLFGFAGRQDDGHDRQLVTTREIHVALIAGRTAEDGPGAVVHQDEVRDVDGQHPGFVERVDRANAGIEAALFGGLDFGDRGSEATAFIAERGEVGIVFGSGARDRMIGGDGQE